MRQTYSICNLICLGVVFAACLTTWFVPANHWVIVACWCVLLMLPGYSISCAICLENWWRTFFIGCSVPLIFGAMVASFDTSSIIQLLNESGRVNIDENPLGATPSSVYWDGADLIKATGLFVGVGLASGLFSATCCYLFSSKAQRMS
jgi:hypothetical protein